MPLPTNTTRTRGPRLTGRRRPDRGPTARRRLRRPLAFEAMEDRTLPSALVIAGNARANTIDVDILTACRRVVYDLDSARRSASYAAFDSIVVDGLGGHDTIRLAVDRPRSLHIPLVLDGGAGDDRIFGGATGERLIGGPGDDTMVGGPGDDTYVFRRARRPEVDTVIESPGGGIDTLDFTALGAHRPVTVDLASTTTFLAKHADRVVMTSTAGQAADFENVIGGAGDDTIIGNAAADRLRGGPGRDRLIAGAGRDRLAGGIGRDRLVAGPGRDRLAGGPGDDVYAAGPLEAGQVATVCEHQGGGTDTLDFAALPVTQPVTVDLSATGEILATGSDGAPIIRTVRAGQAANLEDVFGGAGDDRLIGNDAANRLDGGPGDDTLISIGGGRLDTLIGGAGFDGFWADASATEKIKDIDPAEAADNVHRIASFETLRVVHGGRIVSMPVGRELDGPRLIDPYSDLGRYRYYGDRPLFAPTGPTPDDIFQGAVGDCYCLATLGAIAEVDPNRIRQSIVDLGDGTYAARFYDGDRAVYLRVDNRLPTWPAGQPVYAKLGADQSLWPALLEKAWAFFRSGEGTYRSTDSGNPLQVFFSLGAPSGTLAWPYRDGAHFLGYIQGQLASGLAVTAVTPASVPTDVPLIGGHAYTVIAVLLDSQGNPSRLVVRNPWGRDGAGQDNNPSDGYVTIGADQAFRGIAEVESAPV